MVFALLVEPNSLPENSFCVKPQAEGLKLEGLI